VYQSVANNNVTAAQGDGTTLGFGGDRLAPTAGLYSALSGTTDANGMVTFSGTELVLGGRYVAKVAPMTFSGQVLIGAINGYNFWEYSENPTMVITMANNATPELFATSASNRDPAPPTPSGVLTITFNQPISLDTTFFSAVLSGTTGTVTSPVNALVSADNQTITLTPTFTATPTEDGQILTYAWLGTTITLINSQSVAQCAGGDCNLFTGGNEVTNITDDNVVSGVVHLILD
jgi:hypothetical protein